MTAVLDSEWHKTELGSHILKAVTRNGKLKNYGRYILIL